MAATPIQPSPIPIAAASHFGAPTHTNLSTIAVAAPAHTIASTDQRHAPARPSRHTAVYVPAINGTRRRGRCGASTGEPAESR